MIEKKFKELKVKKGQFVSLRYTSHGYEFQDNWVKFCWYNKGNIYLESEDYRTGTNVLNINQVKHINIHV